jgi:precorrin-4/cobalt-precorrin-4 C11-methyltransferase
MIQFVGAGPGDVELITVKGVKALENADCVIYAGSLVNKELLGYCKQDVSVHNSASMTLEEVVDVMTQAVNENKKVVRLHTGDPSLFGAIKEQMTLLKAKNISYEVIPGVSSFCGAAAAIQEEFTLPGISQTVILTRIAGRTGKNEGGSLKELSKHKASMAIFLSVQNIEEVVKDLLEGYLPTTPVAVVYKATWQDQKIVRATLGEIAKKVKEANIERFAQILVGDFMGDQYELSKLYDKEFSHMYRMAESNRASSISQEGSESI